MWKVPDVKLLCMLQILGALQSSREIKLYTVRSQSACWSFGERNRSYLTQTNEERVTLTPDGEILLPAVREFLEKKIESMSSQQK